MENHNRNQPSVWILLLKQMVTLPFHNWASNQRSTSATRDWLPVVLGRIRQDIPVVMPFDRDTLSFLMLNVFDTWQKKMKATSTLKKRNLFYISGWLWQMKTHQKWPVALALAQLPLRAEQAPIDRSKCHKAEHISERQKRFKNKTIHVGNHFVHHEIIINILFFDYLLSL